MSVNSSLQHYVEEQILPRYDFFDAAHRRDHVIMVIDQSMTLVRQLNEKAAYEGVGSLDENMAYAIAAYHDTGLCDGRDQHHQVSARIIREDDRLRDWFSQEQIEIMAEAAEDHRASAKNAPRSIYGRIVAEADRYIDPEQIVMRTIQYGLDHYPSLGREEHYQRMVNHLQEKYGRGGYLKLWFQESPNAARLEQLRVMIEDEAMLHNLFERFFAQ